jgi:hypothetical protein
MHRNCMHPFNFPIYYYCASNNFVSIFFSLCTGAEHLCQIIFEAVPDVFFDSGTAMITMLSSEVAVHILNHLFNKLSDVCLVQGGEVVKIPCLSYFIFYSFFKPTNHISFFMHVPGGPLPNVAIFICWYLITLSPGL